MERLLTENAQWSLLVDEGRLEFPRIPTDRWTRIRSRVVFIHLNNTNPALDRGGPQDREIQRKGFEVVREGLRIAL